MTAKKFQKEEIMTLEEAIEKDGQRHIYMLHFSGLPSFSENLLKL